MFPGQLQNVSTTQRRPQEEALQSLVHQPISPSHPWIATTSTASASPFHSRGVAAPQPTSSPQLNSPFLTNQPQMAALAAAAAAASAGHYSLWPSYRAAAAAAAVAAFETPNQPSFYENSPPAAPAAATPSLESSSTNFFYPYHLAAAAAMASSQMAIFQQRIQQQQNMPPTTTSEEADLPSSTTQEPKTPTHQNEDCKAKNPYSIDSILQSGTSGTSKRKATASSSEGIDLTPEKRLKVEEEEETRVSLEDEEIYVKEGNNE